MKVVRKPVLLFVLAIGCLVAAGTTPAMAADGGSPTVTLAASAPMVTYPSVVTLTAVASSTETTIARFQVRSADSSQWATLATVTSATGRFAYLYVPTKNSYYRVAVGSAQSADIYVPVRPLLSKPRANTDRIKSGRVLHLYGTIRPYHPVGTPAADITYRLYWERWDSRLRKWRPAKTTPMSISSAVDNDTTRWAYDYGAHRPGKLRVRFFHECPRHKATYSPWFGFQVVR